MAGRRSETPVGYGAAGDGGAAARRPAGGADRRKRPPLHRRRAAARIGAPARHSAGNPSASLYRQREAAIMGCLCCTPAY